MEKVNEMKYFWYKAKDINPYSNTYGEYIWLRDESRDYLCNDPDSEWLEPTGNSDCRWDSDGPFWRETENHECRYESEDPNWTPTGSQRCHNQISQVEYIDINTNSSTYNQTEWRNGGTLDCNCVDVEPNYVDTTTYRCVNGVGQVRQVDTTGCNEARWVDSSLANCKPTWQKTGNVRCNGNVSQEEYKDITNTTGYVKAKNKWENGGNLDCSCIGQSTEPKFELVSLESGCVDGKYIEVYQDTNPCSPTYKTKKQTENVELTLTCDPCHDQSTEPKYDIPTDEYKCDEPTFEEEMSPSSPLEVDKVLRRKYRNSNECYKGSITEKWIFESYDGCDCEFVEDDVTYCDGYNRYQNWKNTNELRPDCKKSRTLVKENDETCGYINTHTFKWIGAEPECETIEIAD